MCNNVGKRSVREQQQRREIRRNEETGCWIKRIHEEKKSKGKEYKGKKGSNSKKTFVSCNGVRVLTQELQKNHISHQATHKAFLNHK